MAVIDLRKGPMFERQMHRQNLQGFGQSIEDMVNRYRREKLQYAIVGTLQQAAANGWKPEQTRRELLNLPNIFESQFGQEMAQAETNTGRYYRDPLDVQYKLARIDATEALTKSRQQEGAQGGIDEIKKWQDFVIKTVDAIDKAIDPDLEKQLQGQLELGRRKLAELTGTLPTSGAKSTSKPVPTEVDAVTMAAPIIDPASQPQPPKSGVALAGGLPVRQSEKAEAGTPSNQQLPPVPSDYNPYVPPGVQANWMASTPEQRRAMMFKPGGTSFEDISQSAQQFIEPTKADRTIAQEINAALPQDITASANSPAGLESIWGNLDESDKQKVRELLSKGATPQQLIAHFYSKAGK